MTSDDRRGGVAGRTLLLAAAVASWATGVATMAAAGMPTAVVVGGATTQLVMLGSGAIIVLRSDAPRLGWLLVATGATLGYWNAVDELPRTGELAGLAHSVAPLSIVPFLLVIAAFPNARPSTRLARGVERFAIVVSSVAVLLMVASTLGLVGGDWTRYRQLFEVAIVVTVLGTIVNHALTYRRRPRVEQQQLKYFALVLFVASAQLTGFWLGIPEAEALDPVMPGLISVTILLAITRYRLYDIDRIVSRTVAYGLVVAALGAVFVGGVAVISSLLPTQEQLPVALTTLAVVAMFDPLRRRVTAAVDRRFDRRRYVAQQVVEDFGRAVQDVTDPAEVVERVHVVAGTTLAPATVAVWQPRTGASS